MNYFIYLFKIDKKFTKISLTHLLGSDNMFVPFVFLNLIIDLIFLLKGKYV